MTTAGLERSLDQRMEALRGANEIRVKRAVLKRDLKAGRASIIDVLLEPPAYIESAKVFDVLMAAPKFGRVKANHVLHLCRISPSKTVSGLSKRQRTALISMVPRRPGRNSARPLERPALGTVPETQHMRALALANSTRLDRSALKLQVAAGEITVTAVLQARPDAAESMTIADLLMSQHRWGRTRMRRFLAAVQILETKTVENMTDRQRTLLIDRLSYE